MVNDGRPEQGNYGKEYTESFLTRAFGGYILDIDEALNKLIEPNSPLPELDYTNPISILIYLARHFNNVDTDFIWYMDKDSNSKIDSYYKLYDNNTTEVCDKILAYKLKEMMKSNHDITSHSFEVKSQASGTDSWFYETVANNNFEKGYGYIPHSGKNGGSNRSKAEFYVCINYKDKDFSNPINHPDKFIIISLPELQSAMKAFRIGNRTPVATLDGRCEGYYFDIEFLREHQIPFVQFFYGI